MRVTPPEQLSSVPAIDQQALAWAGALGDGLGKIRISELRLGFGTATFPGGQTFTTNLVVTHGLTKAAAAVFTQALNLPAGSNGPPTSGIVPGPSAQQFQVQWFTIDGVAPVNGSFVNFYWLAMI